MWDIQIKPDRNIALYIPVFSIYRPPLAGLYGLSFLYYGAVGMLVTIIVGLLISIVLGRCKSYVML